MMVTFTPLPVSPFPCHAAASVASTASPDTAWSTKRWRAHAVDLRVGPRAEHGVGETRACTSLRPPFDAAPDSTDGCACARRIDRLDDDAHIPAE